MSEATRQFVHAECREWLDAQPESSIHCCVTDAPYGLSTVSKTGKRSKGGFMGKQWDYDVPSVEMWAALLRVLKPGGSLLCFAGTRTQHRMAVNIEDAGFRLVDNLMWIHGEGFAKGGDVGKYIDEKLGATREVVGTKVGLPGYSLNQCKSPGGVAMSGNVDGSLRNPEAECAITAPATPEAKRFDGYKTQLKPAYEPIILAMKPNDGSYAENALKHGVAGLNVEACKVPGGHRVNPPAGNVPGGNSLNLSVRGMPQDAASHVVSGRYPPNLLHDGSDEVLAGFPNLKAGVAVRHRSGGNTCHTSTAKPPMPDMGYADDGSAARFFPSLGWTEDELRFFYTAKANKSDRGDGNTHATVKPVKLMRWLVRLVCPPGGTVLDPFLGSGTTAVACHVERLNFIGVEQDPESVEIARERVRTQCAQVMLEL